MVHVWQGPVTVDHAECSSKPRQMPCSGQVPQGSSSAAGDHSVRKEQRFGTVIARDNVNSIRSQFVN